MSEVFPTQSRRRISLKSPWMVSALLLVLVAIFDWPNLPTITLFAINAFFSTLKYIVFAVVLIAGLKAAGAETMIANAFKGREVRMIFAAAMFGGLAPFCSCEVIPFISGLLMLGAPLSAVMAFWLSSPLIDPPTLFITAGALGWPFAIGKAVAAVGLGIMGGFLVRVISRWGYLASPLRPKFYADCGCGPSLTSGKPKWAFWQDPSRRTVFKQEFITTCGAYSSRHERGGGHVIYDSGRSQLGSGYGGGMVAG